MTDSTPATAATVMAALTYRCAHTGPPVDGECGDCATLRDEIVEALTDSTPATAAPCPQGRTDYEACFAPFRYCPVKGCGRTEAVTPPPPTYLDGLRAARAVVEQQTDLTELVHFDRPSDFRKGVLTCLVALDAAIGKAEADAD